MYSSGFPPKGHRIGFVSTRFEGNDGVSLETEKWVEVLERLNCRCFFLAGSCEWDGDRSLVVPEAHFKHPEIQEINAAAFSQHARPPQISNQIHKLKEHLKYHIYRYVRQFGIELLIVENALAIPMNIPLGLALTEFIAETGIPTIAHHHDFFWERKRFLVNCVWDYLNMAFPPHLSSIHHVVINSHAAHQLSLRTGVSCFQIPNVMDFEHPPAVPDEYTHDIRPALGIKPGERFFLQPTRVVPRKGIEHAIELTRRLNLNARLVISHASGDEGPDYELYLQEYARFLGVPVNFVSDIIGEKRMSISGQKIYTLADTYPYADLVTYPSDLEGFGNAFLEAVYFRRPVLVNNYSIFATDIKPKGFKVIEFDSFIADETVDHTLRVLRDPGLAQEMAETNYQLGQCYYSYQVLERRLQTLLAVSFGEECEIHPSPG